MRIQFNVLKKLGLTDKEVRIYLSCLEFGGMTIGQIVQRTAIARSTINDSIKKLMEKGYLSISMQGKKKMYIPATIEELVTIQEKLAKEKKEKAEMLKRYALDFQEIQKKSFIVPHVKFYQGKDVIEVLYNYVHQTRIYYSFFSADHVMPYANEYDKMIIDFLLNNTIPHKILLTDTDNGKKLAEDYKSLGINVRLLPKHISLFTDNIILDNKFLYISYHNDKITAFEIKDELFVKSQRAIFESARQSCLY